MNTKYKNSFIIKCINVITVLYIVSLFTVTSHESLYIINRLLFFALVAVFLALVFLFRTTIKLETIIFSTLPIIILIILSNIWAVDTGVSLNRTIGIIFYYLGAIIVYLLVYNKILSINKILQALLLSVIILSITAGYEYYFSGVSRGGGLAGNPNTFGLNIVFLCPLIWAINKLQLNGGSRFLELITVAALINASVISGGRKVLIASILILLFYYIFSGRSLSIELSYSRIISFIFLGLLLILLLITNINNLTLISGELSAVNRLLDKEEASALIRENMFNTSIQLFSERPILGYGIDNYSVVSLYGTYSHNNYTELLVSIGIIGLALYYFVYVKLIFYSKRVNKNSMSNSGLIYFTTFYLLLFLVLEVALVNLYRPSIWLLLIVVILLNKYANTIEHQRINVNKGTS